MGTPKLALLNMVEEERNSSLGKELKADENADTKSEQEDCDTSDDKDATPGGDNVESGSSEVDDDSKRKSSPIKKERPKKTEKRAKVS